MTFGTYTPHATYPQFDGVQHLFRLANGWTVSVVRTAMSYGGSTGLWEALAWKDFEADVGPRGWLTEDDVAAFLAEVEAR